MFGGLEMTKKKMGGLGKLSQFSGIKPQRSPSAVAIVEDLPVVVVESADAAEQIVETPPSPVEVKVENKIPEINQGEKLVVINIKITKGQKNWLAEIASQVRENNTEPVPPSERVYPQHLIGVAIDLLESVDVDWDEIKNVEELRKQLNL
jgi:hypothetical protein